MSEGQADLRVSCPGSKSMTQRALLIAALGDGPATISGGLRCDDSRYLSEVLGALGVAVRWDGERVDVAPGLLAAPEGVQYVGNAGTAMRFAACLSLLVDGELVLDGDARMRERPIGALVEGLAALGVSGRYLGRAGYPPIALARGAALQSEVELDISLSSQYASGLLLVAPRLPAGLVLRLKGDKVSLPYLHMTVEMMRRAGAEVRWPAGADEIAVAPGHYRARHLMVEPDWSTAAFLLGAAQIAGCEVDLPGLEAPGRSLQGDAAFAAFLAQLRARAPVRIDLRDTPDLIAPLAAVALFARAPTRLEGVAHARVKECDRIAVLAAELTKVGAVVREQPDGIEIEPLDRSRVPAGPIELDPASDHRMAMAFGLVSLRVPTIVVREPDCVSKSFPAFWRELERFKARLR